MLGEEETIEERIAHFNLEIKKPFLTEPIQELDRAFNWKILFSLHLMYSTLHIHSLQLNASIRLKCSWNFMVHTFKMETNMVAALINKKNIRGFNQKLLHQF